MSRQNDAETNYLKLILQNIAWANVGDGSGLQPSGTPGSFYVSLHTGDPGEAGNQETSEATFGSYARQAVARSAAGWNVAAGVGDNNGPITFPEASSGSESITYVGIGTDSTGTGNLIWSGILDAARAVSAGITLQFADTALDITAD